MLSRTREERERKNECSCYPLLPSKSTRIYFNSRASLGKLLPSLEISECTRGRINALQSWQRRSSNLFATSACSSVLYGHSRLQNKMSRLSPEEIFTLLVSFLFIENIERRCFLNSIHPSLHPSAAHPSISSGKKWWMVRVWLLSPFAGREKRGTNLRKVFRVPKQPSWQSLDR